MRHDVGLVCVLTIAACSSSSAPKGPELQITGESVKVKRGEALPVTSAIFDGTTVRLRAAIGETSSVVVWRRDEAPIGEALTIDARGVTIRGYALEDVKVPRASTSMYGPSRGAGAYPDKLVAAETLTAGRAGLFDVTVDWGAGTFAGTLHVGAQAFPVELVVDDVSIPAVDEALIVWAYVNPKEVAAAGRTEAEVAATMRRYGVAASPDLGPDDFAARADALRGLPFVPVLLPDDPADRRKDVARWADLLAGTGQTPFAIPIDEPRDDAARAEVRAIAEAVHEVACCGKFLLAVTDEPRAIYGDAVDVFITPNGLRRERDDVPRRWTYNGGEPTAGALIVDTDGVAMRTWGWIAWRWRVPLWYVWDAAYWTDRHNTRKPAELDADATTFDDGEDHGALDGVLVYPDGAPSLRLAALRRGLEDRLLLQAVEACAGRPAAEAIAATVVPAALGDTPKRGRGAWPKDEPAWEAARLALLDRLLRCD